MSVMSWLARRLPNIPFHHVNQVATDDAGIHCKRVNGTIEDVKWNDINRVMIRTNDRGPVDDDVFFVIETRTTTLVIPQPASGSDQLLERLQQLAGFNNEAVIDSMSCCENKEFVGWQRPQNKQQPSDGQSAN
jgi:hypothetical protein